VTIDMRAQFTETTARLLRENPRLALVLAEIGTTQFAAAGAPEDRVFNVGIREQLMIGVASGLALTGFRPVVHTIATFAVERPFEQLKLDLGHQDVGAIVVAHGASYDYAESGRTHQAPEDVALIDALPGWSIHVPGHPEELPGLLERLATEDGRAYVRLSVQENADPHRPGVIRTGTLGTVMAVGPMLDRVLAATADVDVNVVYLTTVRPFDDDVLRTTLGTSKVALVEPYLEGTSSVVVSRALEDVPHQLLAIGVKKIEHRAYGSPSDHDRAHGLDSASLSRRLKQFFSASSRDLSAP